MAEKQSGKIGGARVGAGRPKGTPNKATIEIRDLAKSYAPECVKELARLAKEAESEQARVGAIKEILDRAYGKSTQPVSGDPDNPLIPTKITIELVQP